MDCAVVAQDISNHQSSDGNMGRIGDLPALAEYPSNLDWPSFDTSLCNRVLSLRHELELSRLSVDFAYEVEGHLGDGDETKAQAVKVGLKAWRLSKELRQHYALPSLPLNDIWDFPKYLDDEASKLEALRNKPDVCLE